MQIPNRKARRAAMKGKVIKETFSEWQKRISESNDMGKRIHELNKEASETASLEAEADKNAQQLEDFIKTFGEEKGLQMYNDNLALKNKQNN